jgi:hypothetical protein
VPLVRPRPRPMPAVERREGRSRDDEGVREVVSLRGDIEPDGEEGVPRGDRAEREEEGVWDPEAARRAVGVGLWPGAGGAIAVDTERGEEAAAGRLVLLGLLEGAAERRVLAGFEEPAERLEASRGAC